MIDLLNEIVRRAERGERLAVCTLVATAGSTPQRAGAVMLVLGDGTTVGTIGGGCVEAEVRTRALRTLAGKQPGGPAELMTFKLDHDLGWDDGLICGGTMHVAVESVDSPASAEPFRRARDELDAGRAVTLTTAATGTDGQSLSYAREMHPTPHLIIAGAGHVALALHPIARAIGFDVTVIDDRPDMCSGDRFPGAQCRVGAIEGVLGSMPIGARSHVTIVTRGHRNDARALAAVIGRGAAYVGLIGSRRKVIAIFEELKHAGTPLDALGRVHAPIGLEIGAVTPAEIAVSIAAELVAVRRGAKLPAGSLRLSGAQLERLAE